ncbi:MAG: hypothetical protein N2596_02605 [Syntrophorhabdaceae bacterium]|nr:hypothetical protein [Syntrophorhabdaceae bacterium]
MLNHHDGRIRFPCLASVELIYGGWLEDYVFSNLSSLPVTDVFIRVDRKWDVVYAKTHNERVRCIMLYIITGYFSLNVRLNILDGQQGIIE